MASRDDQLFATLEKQKSEEKQLNAEIKRVQKGVHFLEILSAKSRDKSILRL